MDLVIVNNGLAGGGTERESTSFANYLSKKGLKIKIIASHKSHHFFDLHHGIKFIEPDFNRDAYSLISYTIKLILYLRKEILNSGSKKVLSYNESLNPYVILAGLGIGIDVYVRESMHPKAYHPIVTRFLKWALYRKAKLVLAQTNYGKEVLGGKLKTDNIVALPNPVVTHDFKESRSSLKIILAIGRLEEVKGHRYLIKAFSKIKDKSWRLEIIGDGSLKKELVQLSHDLGVSERVIFHGHLKTFDEHLKRSEIFVLPSIKEGFPNALVEAMSVPLACIAGDYYEGSIEIIHDGVNGILFQPCNDDNLAEKLELLINSPVLRKKIKMKSVAVRDQYGIEQVGKHLCDLLELL